MPTRKAKLGFFASHGGSNFQSVVEACQAGQVHAEPAALIYNNPKAHVKNRAESLGVPAFCINDVPTSIANKDDRILEILKEYEVDLVVLAGYMKKIGEQILHEYDGRILNIHPSLLPKYGGKGMYGKYVHEAVIEAGEKESGASIHVVTAGYDEGPVIAQEKVSVSPTDTPDLLAAKVLQVEHVLYPKTIQKVILGEINLPEPGEHCFRDRLSD